MGLVVCTAASLMAAGVNYTITTVAGGTFCGDGLPATAAYLGAPDGLAIDREGNLYLSDSQDHRIRKIDASGVITTIAGNGHGGFGGDGGPAEAAQLDTPYGLAIDAAGNLYVADLGNHRVRMISLDGRIRTVAGGGGTGASAAGDATAAHLVQPRNLAVDRQGNLYISDFGDHRVYRVTPSGLIERIAGLGWAGSIEDSDVILAELAPLRAPAGLAVGSDGVLYIADSGNGRVRKIERGLMSTVPAEGLGLPTGLALDAAGSLYVADKSTARVLRLTPAPAAPVAGDGTSGYSGDGGPATAARLAEPREILFDAAGNLYIADSQPGGRYPVGMLRKVSPDGLISTAAGGTAFRPLGDFGPPTQAHLEAPSGVAVGPDGALYISDRLDHRVRQVASGVIRTIAGTGQAGSAGDSGLAVEAQLDQPAGLAMDSAGRLWIAEAGGSRVRQVTPGGIITRVAGLASGELPGYSGDGSAATVARLNYPEGVAVDAAGSAYIADTFNHVIRKVGPDGSIATVAGKGVPGYAGDGGPAALALLDSPTGVVADGNGSLFIADSGNGAIRRVDLGGAMRTIAVQLSAPTGIAMDASGNLYVADADSHRVLEVAADGALRTIAGTGVRGYGGDGGPALEAELNEPVAVAVDARGNVYVADRANNRIRRLAPPTLPPEPPAPEPFNLVNAASMTGGPVAPGELVTLFGTGLGPEDPAYARLNEAGELDTSLGDTQVLFDGRPAPLLYVQSRQINLQVPYEVFGRGTTEIEIRVAGQTKAFLVAAVAEVAPAVFTASGGAGQAAAINQDGSANSAASAAPHGAIVALYATGEGQRSPAGVSGRPAAAGQVPLLPVSVTIGGEPAEILYAGAAPGYAGLMQVNARVPASLAPGDQPVALRLGSAESQPGVTIAVR